MSIVMNPCSKSYFRRNIEFTMQNFSRSTIVCANYAKFEVVIKPIFDTLEFKFSSHKKVINGQNTNEIGVMVYSTMLKPLRCASFLAKISIIETNGKLRFCTELDDLDLNEKRDTAKTWKPLINVDEIFADEKRFLSGKCLKFQILLQMTKANIPIFSQMFSPVHQNYESLVNNPQFSDIKITCSDGNTIHAHKCILMSFSNQSVKESKPSKFFCSLIENQMQKGQNVNAVEFDSKIMLELMRFIYTGFVSQLHNQANELLTVADKYDIIELKKVCVEALEQMLSEENVVELLKKTYTMNLPKVRENCIDYIKLNIDSISKRNDYKTLSPDILRTIIESMNSKSLKLKINFNLKKSVTFSDSPVTNLPLRSIFSGCNIFDDNLGFGIEHGRIKDEKMIAQ